jgi:hypothetical protein
MSGSCVVTIRTFLTVVCLLAPAVAAGQELVELARLGGPVELDGLSNEPAWEAVDPLPLTTHWPRFGGAISERTEIRVAYDDDHIYFAGRFYDSDPAGIRRNSLYRDRWNGDDAFDIVVDSFNDNETALMFTTTPLGIMIDQEVSNDADPSGGARPLNLEWNGYWDVAARVTQEGWFAEVRIPFSSLGFEVEGERVVMGLIVGRYVSRKDEKYIFPAIPPNWDMADVKPSQAQDVLITGINEKSPLYVTPYVLGGLDRTREFVEPVRAPGTEATRRVGLDAKYGLSSNITLDLTLNTDFAQVEADDQQVNLTRFNLFVPEKRRFFQERASIFQFNTGDEGHLFHSRRIGLTEDGMPLPILAGARLTGRLGDWDVAAMDMLVDGDADEPRENAGVLRLRRSVLNDASTLGAMATSRATYDGSVDLAYGLDAALNLFGDEYLTLQWTQTYDSREGAPEALDAALVRAFWQRRSLNGLGYELEAMRAGPAYDPAMGFMERYDFTAFKTNFTYSWQPGGESLVNRHKAWLTSRLYLRNGDGSVESALQRFRWSTYFRGGSFFNIALNFFYEDLDEPLSFSDDVSVPAGGYFGSDVFLYYELNPGARLKGDAVLHAGSYLDGWRGRLSLRPAWVVSSHLTLNLQYDLNRLWFPRRAQSYDADIGRLRVQAALDTHLSLDAFLQYNMAADRLATNLRVRYRLAEGRDLFLVYNAARDLCPAIGDLAVVGRSDQRLLVKYEHTFQPGF